MDTRVLPSNSHIPPHELPTFSRGNARWPCTAAAASFSPPNSFLELDKTSNRHCCRRARRSYIPKTSPANSEASSPPVPARTSKMRPPSSSPSSARGSSRRSTACSSSAMAALSVYTVDMAS